MRDLLAVLAVNEPGLAKELRLVLLSLRGNSQPWGSRELEPELVEVASGERIWERPHWVITYRIDSSERKVAVGLVERR